LLDAITALRTDAGAQLAASFLPGFFDDTTSNAEKRERSS
jgi:hypothetical protein